jgi:CheY-like chemotaxis protein
MMLRSQLPEEPLASWIVLCVGNDPSRLLLYRSLLELDGYSVLLAETVEDGLELSRKKMIDCIVLDHARGGAVLAQEIGRRRARLISLIRRWQPTSGHPVAVSDHGPYKEDLKA